MQQLIIASNRLPFSIDKKGDKYEIKQSSGGLVSALQSIPATNNSITWTGIADFKQDSWSAIKNSLQTSVYKLDPIFVDKKKYNQYYNGFSNTLIWPLFHYFPSYAEFDEDCFEAYKHINKTFADHIIKTAEPGATLWIHDYHLMLLPKFIKELRPDINIGFFLHIPFPSYEILKLIPAGWRQEIFEGLMLSDVLGFHTSEYLNHFKRSLAYFYGATLDKHNNSNTLIKIYPISVDFYKFNNAFDLPSVARGRSMIRQKQPNSKIIFSVDRLDYTKGVMNRLHAYESLLENHPEQREKVVFVINIVPSRDQITKYAERKKMIEENIGRINGLYGSVNWQPVIYQYRHLTFNQLMSFYTVTDIALVTPLRDGMNLVAKEFVASRKDKKGVLILSEFAGAASELKSAILVNPNDIITLKNGILKALSLTETEQVENIEAMQTVIKNNDIYKWTDSFLSDLKKIKKTNYNLKSHVMTFEERLDLFDAYQNAKKRLILLDYDGTLVPYYNRPEEAKPDNKLKELIKDLTDQPENTVVVISGRDATTLENWFSGLEVSVVAEHGALFKKADTAWTTLASDCTFWKNPIVAILEKYVSQYEGAFIEKKGFSVVFHYRMVDTKKTDKLKADISRELSILDEQNHFNILFGNKIIEAKSAQRDKGSFVSKLMNEINFDFVLAIGDDKTDEDMFAVLAEKSNCYSIKVGTELTAAKCNLINVNNVISLLDQLSKYKSVTYLK